MLAPVLAPLLLEALRFAQELEQNGPVERDIDALEFMAGEAEISKAVSRLGMSSVAYDKSYASCGINDINTKVGFHRAMSLAWRVRRHGCIWAAPVCSSWTWIGRNGSGRSKDEAHGDVSVARVRSGNCMVVRLVLIFLVAWTRGVHLFMENPVSTLIHEFSPLREFIQCLMPFRSCAHLSFYGATSQKPLSFWSTSRQVFHLRCPKGKAVEKLSVKNGDSVTGNRKALKSSQAYPKAFGEKVASIFAQILSRKSLSDLFESDACKILFLSLKSSVHSDKKRKRGAD